MTAAAAAAAGCTRSDTRLPQTRLSGVSPRRSLSDRLATRAPPSPAVTPRPDSPVRCMSARAAGGGATGGRWAPRGGARAGSAPGHDSWECCRCTHASPHPPAWACWRPRTARCPRPAPAQRCSVQTRGPAWGWGWGGARGRRGVSARQQQQQQQQQPMMEHASARAPVQIRRQQPDHVGLRHHVGDAPRRDRAVCSVLACVGGGGANAAGRLGACSCASCHPPARPPAHPPTHLAGCQTPPHGGARVRRGAWRRRGAPPPRGTLPPPLPASWTPCPLRASQGCKQGRRACVCVTSLHSCS